MKFGAEMSARGAEIALGNLCEWPSYSLFCVVGAHRLGLIRCLVPLRPERERLD